MNHYIVIDTETTNGFEDPICYDVGWAVIDENAEVLLKRSFVVADIFLDEPQLMAEAFFADKIPQYFDDVANGLREFRRFKTIRSIFHTDCTTFNVKAVMAHNMPFDYRSTTTTQRWLTSSKYRYFFPYGIELWDTLRIARETLGKDEDYKRFCKENDFCCANGTPRLTAEIIYKYITKNLAFEEEHTGLADVLIEKEIFKYCIGMNPNVERKAWA